jgi:hypothetical protein
MIAFEKGKTFLQDGAFRFETRKDILSFALKWGGLAILQLVFEVAMWKLTMKSLSWNYIGADILMALYWMIVYIMFAQKIQKNIKHTLVTYGIFMIILTISIICDISTINDIGLLSQKYQDTSPYLLRTIKNATFMHDLRLFVADTCYFCILIIVYAFSHENHIKSKSTTSLSVTNEENNAIRIFRAFIRCDLILACIIFIGLFNALTGPMSALTKRTEGGKLSSELKYSYPDTNYYIEYWQRESEVLDPTDVNYGAAELQIKKENSVPVVISLNGAEENCVLGDKAPTNSYYAELLVNDQKCFVYYNRVLCFYDNEHLRVVLVEDLNEMTENYLLTDFLEHLIQHGNLFAFEYGYEYLTKYDSNFINPYIERYAQGDYTENELLWIKQSFYQQEYIQNLAKAILVEE